MAVAISQMNAFMIEILRSKGMTPEAIFHNAREKNLEAFTELDSTFTYEELVKSVDENAELMKDAIFNGYTMKFNTIRGVKRILQFKFQVNEDDYTETDNRFNQIQLSEADLVELKNVLAPNWSVINEKSLENGHIEFSIVNQIDLQ